MNRRHSKRSKDICSSEDENRSMKSRRIQQSQSKTTHQKSKKSSQSQDAGRSQTSIKDFAVAKKKTDNKPKPEEVNELARNATFYLLTAGSNKLPVSRAEISKVILVNHNPRTYYSAVVEKASEMLLQTFGLKLMPGDDKPLTSSGKVFLVNPLGPKVMAVGNRDEAHDSLLLLLLACIVLAGGQTTEENLLDFLVALSIKPQDTHNSGFDNVGAHLNLYKSQTYLKYSVDKSAKQPTTMVEWGPRAQAEISKREIFNFIKQIYPDVAMTDILNAGADETSSSEHEDEENEGD